MGLIPCKNFQLLRNIEFRRKTVKGIFNKQKTKKEDYAIIDIIIDAINGVNAIIETIQGWQIILQTIIIFVLY